MTASPPTPPAPNQDGTLDLYLDGELTGEALAAFERRLAGDAELRGQVEQQRRIDDSLRRRMAPPAAFVLAEGASSGGHDAGASGAGRGGPGWVWMAAAAMVVLAAIGSWWGWQQLVGGPGPAERFYIEHAALGLKPDWVCENDQQMIEYLGGQFGQRLVVPSAAAAAAGVELVGWTSAPLLSHYTSVLLTRVEGRPVLVLVDFEKAEAPALSKSGGLRVFERRTAGVVLYEVTPREGPAVLELFTTSAP